MDLTLPEAPVEKPGQETSPEQTLAEIRRVLRPGGTFLFLEHVAAPRGSWKRRVQGLLTPCWRYFADGCHLNRELGAEIDAAGFASVEKEAFDARLPHIWGRACV